MQAVLDFDRVAAGRVRNKNPCHSSVAQPGGNVVVSICGGRNSRVVNSSVQRYPNKRVLEELRFAGCVVTATEFNKIAAFTV